MCAWLAPKVAYIAPNLFVYAPGLVNQHPSTSADGFDIAKPSSGLKNTSQKPETRLTDYIGFSRHMSARQ
jgi:hypothetical protein